MERIAVIGTSGSGKTTLARQLADRLGMPHLELDAIYHQPGWEPLDDDEFQLQVSTFCAHDRWVTCGKYAAVRELIFARADTIVCLDHNRARQTARVAGRTLRRQIRREELWNGNYESWRNLWPFGDPSKSIVHWTWRNVPRVRTLFDDLENGTISHDAQVIRLRGWAQIDDFLNRVPAVN